MSSSSMEYVAKMCTEMRQVTDTDIQKVSDIINDNLKPIVHNKQNRDWVQFAAYCTAVCKLPNQIAYPFLVNILKEGMGFDEFRTPALAALLEVQTDRTFRGNPTALKNHLAMVSGMSGGSFARSEVSIINVDSMSSGSAKSAGASGIFSMFDKNVYGGTQMTPYSAQKYSGVYDGPHMVPYSGQRGGDLVTREEIVDFRQALHSIGHRVQVQGQKLQAQGAQLESQKVTIDETATLSRTNAADIKAQAAAQAATNKAQSEANKAQSEATKANTDMYQSFLQAKITNQAAKVVREEAAEKKRQEVKAEKKAGKELDLNERIAEQAFQVYRVIEEQKVAAAAAAAKKKNEAAGEEESDSDHEEQVGAKRSHRAGGGAAAKGKAPAKPRK